MQLKNTELVRIWKPSGDVLEKIKHLATLRERMVHNSKKINNSYWKN